MCKRMFILESVFILASLLLAACAPAAPVKVIETVVLIQTQIVEVPGKQVVEVVTPTPLPTATEVPLKPVSPEFKNPDTYMIIDGVTDQVSLDPAWMYEFVGGAINSNIYEGLVWQDRDKDEDYVPALATEWTSSPDGLTWTFTIRKDVTFHEGGTLEPHDVAYTLWRSMLQGRTNGPQWLPYEAFFGADLSLASIKDFSAAYLGKETFDGLGPADLVKVCEAIKSKVAADDEAGTVTFHLAQPTPWMMNLLTRNFMGMIVDQEWMVEQADWNGECDTWQDFADPPAEKTVLYNRANGTGPYKLDHWTPGEEVVLVANENYWRKEPAWEGGPSGPPRIQRVVYKSIAEWETRLAMFEAGEADWIYVLPQDRAQLYPYAKEYCSADGLTCEEANPQGYIRILKDLPWADVVATMLNWQINTEGGNPYIGSGALDGNGIPPDFFQDIHIRKAFNYCFDYQAMIDESRFEEGIQAQGPIPKGMLGYREGEAPLYTYDPARCEEEFKLADLDKDGLPAGEDEDDIWTNGFYMQIPYNTGNETRRLAAEILKEGLEAVNPKFSVQALEMPWSVLVESRRERKLTTGTYGWGQSYYDPSYWVNPFLFSDGSWSRHINLTDDYKTKYNQWIVDGANEIDPEKRRLIYETIQLAVQEDAVNIWMVQGFNMIPVQLWIHGMYFNPTYWREAYSWIYALSKEAP